MGRGRVRVRVRGGALACDLVEWPLREHGEGLGGRPPLVEPLDAPLGGEVLERLGIPGHGHSASLDRGEVGLCEEGVPLDVGGTDALRRVGLQERLEEGTRRVRVGGGPGEGAGEGEGEGRVRVRLRVRLRVRVRVRVEGEGEGSTAE